MWDKVLKAFRETLQKAEDSYLVKAKSFNCTDEENSTALATLRKRAWLGPPCKDRRANFRFCIPR
ncbi:Dynamin-like GTPase that mediates homotypic ER fusion [Cerrena zonata]|uniref:Dynamin-like GTPase that mediates homotypic ER fusion n=1 Tax=Cerrena zonata TaxID=2478898 RepID=A0AAW0GIA7_9APHY